jgi:secreted Zn-dependent insulinase-like peptidase
VALTKRGAMHVMHVLRLIFATINKLKSMRTPKHLFNEMRKIARLNWEYEAQGNVLDQALTLSAELRRWEGDKDYEIPMDLILSKKFGLSDFNPGMISDLFD